MAVFTDEGKTYHVRVGKGDIGRYVLLPGDPFRTDLIASYFDDAKLVAHNREHKTWTGTLNGVPVSVVSTGMGCPSTAICLEELIACGADTFIRVGTAGRVCDRAFDPTLDGVINTAAVRDEGTTKHYIPIEYPAVADRHVVAALADSAKQLGYNFIEGITQSKDSFYGQHEPENMPAEPWLKARWEAWRRGNVISSEMESAAIFVISSIRGCRASSVMAYTEMPKSVEVAVGALRILIEQDKAARKRTTIVLFGRRAGRVFYVLNECMAFLLVLPLILDAPWWILFLFGILFALCFYTTRELFTLEGRALNRTLGHTARNVFLFASVLSLLFLYIGGVSN